MCGHINACNNGRIDDVKGYSVPQIKIFVNIQFKKIYVPHIFTKLAQIIHQSFLVPQIQNTRCALKTSNLVCFEQKHAPIDNGMPNTNNPFSIGNKFTKIRFLIIVLPSYI